MSSDPKKTYTDEELAALSHDELVTLGTNLDGVDVAFRQERWPVPGTKAEKRAERAVAFWFALAGVASLALFLVFLFWPWKYKAHGEDGNVLYSLTTPLYGLLLGIAIMSLGIGVVMFTKKFIPEEISIQDRHDGGSTEVDKKTTAALLENALVTSTLPRRKLIQRSAIFGGSALGLGLVTSIFGGLIKNPWAHTVQTANGMEPALLTSGWTPKFKGEEVFLRKNTGRPHDVVLVRPEDLDAGGMETVFPYRASEGNGTTGESQEALSAALKGIRNPVMLIRLRPEDSARAIKRKGQESFNYGDYFAYTKVCSHLGCPTSLYEQQTNRILCPCHQSQFDALEYGKPLFGPAARALAQLPITVNADGFLVAAGDYIEPVGPAFWERKS